MRILIVSDISSWMPGGVPAETRELIGGLTGRGHVVALASDAPLEGAEGARHFPLTIPVSGLLAEEVERALRAFEPDFVHVICMSSKGVLTLSSSVAATTACAPTSTGSRAQEVEDALVAPALASLGIDRSFRVALRTQAAALA